MVKLEFLFDKFKNLTEAPDKFLTSGLLTEDLKHLLKNLYDFCQEQDRFSDKGLPELIVKDFDDEQIWQELELQNEDCLPKLISKSARLLVSKKLEFPLKTDVKCENKAKVLKKGKQGKKNSKSEAISSEEESDEDDFVDSDDEDLSDNEVSSKKPVNVKIVPSEVDDEFFKLSEMEAFLNDQEEKGDNLGTGIDLFDDMPSDSEEEDDRPMYDDFFNKQNDGNYESEEVEDDTVNGEYDDPLQENDDFNQNELSEEEWEDDKKKRVKFNLNPDNPDSNSDGDSSYSENKVKSSFEVREEKLRKKISELEDENVCEKSWPLKGEVNASSRPVNSLLEEVVEFDMTQRPPPIITEETSNRLEDIIKQRIKDQAYDDVERKVKPISTPNEFKKRLVLDQEKSKLSLAEVYEKEYLKQKEDQTQDPLEKSEAEPEEHQIIKKMMKSLFTKLDSLSNFFFVPKPIAPDLKIINNLPAVQVEEVAPVGMSNAKLLAPEEVGGSFTKTLLAKEERTKTDKKRERRKKKSFQAKKFKVKALKDATKPASYNEELKKVMKFKNVSKLDDISAKSTKTSKDFFSKLQDETQNQSSQKDNTKKRKSNQSGKSAKKLKL